MQWVLAAQLQHRLRGYDEMRAPHSPLDKTFSVESAAGICRSYRERCSRPLSTNYRRKSPARSEPTRHHGKIRACCIMLSAPVLPWPQEALLGSELPLRHSLVPCQFFKRPTSTFRPLSVSTWYTTLVIVLPTSLRRVPVATVRSVLRSLVVLRSASNSELARACAVGEATVKKAISLLFHIRLVQGDESCWKPAAPSLDRTCTDDQLDAAIREGLLAYRPFEGICEGLLAGEMYEQAARHTAVALGLDARAEANLALLRQWGLELGVFIEAEDDINLSADLRGGVAATAALPIPSVTSVAEIRLYISTLLGRDAFDALDEIDRGLLVDAVKECESDPPESVEASGQALEDYLREVCLAQGIGAEAAKLNGAGQLAGLLRAKGRIHPHYLKLVDAASMFRNAKAHKKDKRTVAPWAISPHGARTAFGASTLAIRSIHAWIEHGGQGL